MPHCLVVDTHRPTVVIAPDKFRGTATAREICQAVEAVADEAGWHCRSIPLADGGEGTLDALGGANRTTTVTGPLGDPVDARWRLSGRTAVIEMAQASGLALVGGPGGNDPLSASTYGTGELITAAVEAGARRVVVGLGGSATTDGGLGALRAMVPLARMRGIDLEVACDVRTRFLDAAEVFAPQKGATRRQVELLRRRLERLAEVYRDEHGVDVTELDGSGAAGGLAGGLAAIGARLVEGFELIAEEVGLADAVEHARLVVTGEGHLDAESFDGKVVGGVAALCAASGVPALAVVGAAEPGIEVPAGLEVVSLEERLGPNGARDHTAQRVAEVVAERLGPLG